MMVDVGGFQYLIPHPSSLISHQPYLTPPSSLGYGVNEVVILVFGWWIGCWMCIFFARNAVATAVGWELP